MKQGSPLFVTVVKALPVADHIHLVAISRQVERHDAAEHTQDQQQSAPQDPFAIHNKAPPYAAVTKHILCGDYPHSHYISTSFLTPCDSAIVLQEAR